MNDATQVNKPESISAAAETTSGTSAETPFEQNLLSQPLPVTVLKTLLDKLQVSVEAGALTQAWEQAQQDLTDTSPIQQIKFIIQALKLTSVQPAQLRWDRFDRRSLPALIFYNTQWQLIEHSDNNQVKLTNEAKEVCHYDADSFGDDDGEIFVLWLRCAPQRKKPSVFSLKGNIAARLVFSEVFKSRRWLWDISIATVIINLLAVATSLFAMQVYDRVVPTLAYSTLWTLVAMMVIIASIDWLLKTIRARTLDSVSCAVDKAVSQQVFDHVMQLQLDTRPKSLGTLAAQVGGLDAVRQFFTSGVIFALIDMPFALMFIAFIATIGGSIAWVYLSFLPIALLLGFITQARLRRLLKSQMQRSNERQGLLVDAIQGTESIRASHASWRFSQQWSEITQTISRYGLKQKAISNFGTVTTGSLASLAYVGAIVVGVHEIEAGNLTMGAMIACSILGGRVIAPISQSVHYLAQWQNVSQSLQMVNEVLTLNTQRDEQQTLLMPEDKPESVSLKEVTFSYPNSPIMQLNIDKLQLNSGDRVVLLGPIGSGKSTLLKVLSGLYRPSAGRIQLGQAELWEIEPNLVAQQVSYLPQSVHLFKGTLRSNLTLSGVVGDSQLLQVSQDLGIDQIAADSPQSMDLEISEGGDGLSGGQRQLVGLGRVFLAQPKIWLLDEPTASLDGETEQRVLEAIKRYVKADDILVISSHRPAIAAKLANRVMVMQRGKIIKDGSPEKILSQIMTKAKRPLAPIQPNKGAAHVV